MRRLWMRLGAACLGLVALSLACSVSYIALGRVGVTVVNPRADALCNVAMSTGRETTEIARLAPGATTEISFLGHEDLYLRTDFTPCDAARTEEHWRCYEYVVAQWPLPPEPTVLRLGEPPALAHGAPCERLSAGR